MASRYPREKSKDINDFFSSLVESALSEESSHPIDIRKENLLEDLYKAFSEPETKELPKGTKPRPIVRLKELIRSNVESLRTTMREMHPKAAINCEFTRHFAGESGGIVLQDSFSREFSEHETR